MAEVKGRNGLRQKLDAGEKILMCGAWDWYSAYAAEKAGFDAIAAQSWTIAAARGLPDTGILTPSQLLEIAASITRRASISLIVDAEEGWGDIANTYYWTREFERIGVAGFHIDDYALGQHCPHVPDTQLGILPIPVEETAAKIKAAARARSSRDFVIIVRAEMSSRHAPPSEASFKDLIRRHQIYKEAGADVLYPGIYGPGQWEWLRRYLEEGPPGPKLVQIHPKGLFPETMPELPDISFKEIFDLGAQIINLAFGLTCPAVRYMVEIGQQIIKAGSLKVIEDKVQGEQEWYDIAGYTEAMNLNQQFLEKGN